MLNKYTPIYLFLCSLVLAMLIARLVSCGMFIDGMLYNSVAHNLAHNHGSFWFPFFSKNTMPFFHEQPPLTFWIESLFYRALGDSLWVDAIYTLFTALVGGLIIHQIWQTIVAKQYKAFTWLPVIFWVLIPIVTWTYSNCMEENTMSIFVLLSVLLQAKVIYQDKASTYTILAGFCLALASLCKGFPGLFPLGMMGFAWLTQQVSFKKAAVHTLLLVVALATCYIALYFYPPSNASLTAYLNDRVFNSIKNVSTEGSRFWIINRAFSELLIGIIITISIRLLHRRKYLHEFSFTEDKKAWFFIILGLSGTIPLMVTLEQRGFYITTAMPYFALSFSLFTLPAIEYWLQKASQKWINYGIKMGGVLVFTTLIWVATRINTYRESTGQWSDFLLFQKIIPQHTEVSVPGELWDDWDLHCALNRLSFIVLNGNSNNTLIYFITKKDSNLPIPEGYKKQNISTQYYDLYKK